MPGQPKRTYRKKAETVNLDTLGLEMGNKPPQALEVEEAVLGAMLVEPNLKDIAAEELDETCFYDPRHKMIYEAMLKLANEHSPVDIYTVSEKLKALDNLEAVGGAVAITDLSLKIGAAAHFEYYIKILKQKAIQRALISASHNILKKAFDDSYSVDDLIQESQDSIYEAIQSNMKKDVRDIGSVINDAMDEVQKHQEQPGISGVPSGFPSLDAYTMGWQSSDLIILAARPSVGKTAFSLNLARNAAVQYHMPVAFFSLEMSSLQLAMRLMVSESGLGANKLKGGAKIEPYEWKELEVKLGPLSSAPLYIDDTPGILLSEFETKAKRLVKTKNVKLIFVDYMQLMQGPKELRGMREQEVAAISRGLKATAKELNIPIIALSQLSRQAVQRAGSNGKPQLSDLRESGSIEQDADMVIFLHRPFFLGLTSGQETPEDRENTEIIIAKNRNGAVGSVPMLFKGDQVKFIEPSDSLAAQASAQGTDSAMNFDSIGQGGEFGSNTDF